jgi:hypothetical protein
MTRNPIRVGNLEFQVAVQPQRDGGFTYTLVETDHSGSDVIENRYDSGLRFETENEAYEGGATVARHRAKRVDQGWPGIALARFPSWLKSVRDGPFDAALRFGDRIYRALRLLGPVHEGANAAAR